jgi:putative PIG3 family NAD(P)H quinone oxidoreductase
MKAIVLSAHGGTEVLNYQDIPDPVPGPEDLLVRVHAAALNRADLMQRTGGYPQPGPKPAFEVPGLEFGGEVVGTGSLVEGFAIGDRVMGLLAGGGQAEHVIIHQRMALRVPERLSWVEAGATPEVYITAHDALLQCALAPGESLLVHAAGSGVGVAAVQIAKQVMGASLVIGTAGTDDKIARSRELGLDVGVNYNTADFAEVVQSATNGRGVDVLLDVVGASYLDRNLRSLALRRRMIIVGTMGGGKSEANLGMVLMKRLQVRGTTLRARPLEEKAATTRAFEKSVLPAIASGRVQVIVDRVFPASEVAAAHEYLASNANFGKVVLEF